MKPLTTAQLQELATMQITLAKMEASVALLTDTLTQLSVDKCDTLVTVSCFNQSQFERNNVQQEKDILLDDPGLFGCAPRRRYPNSRIQMSTVMMETNAMRVINALLREYKLEKDKLAERMKKLVNADQLHIAPINPIQHIYETNS